MISLRRLRTLVVREIRATLRDPFTLGMLMAVPILALLLFGFVLATDVKHLPLAVYDGDRSPASRRLVADIGAAGAFDVRPAPSVDAIEHGLVAGDVGVGLVIPPDFARDLGRGGPAPEVQVLYDAAEAVLAGNAEGFLRAQIAAAGGQLAERPVRPGGVAVTTRALFNPRLDGTPFMVSGVFGFVLSFLTTVITAVTIVNERSAGTFEQLQVTPATAVEILLGKLIPLGGVFSFDVALMMLVAGVVMGVWPHGSGLFFLAVSSFYVLVSLSLGLIISATSNTASEAVQKTVILSIPLVQLSGFVFPVRNMPLVLQWVAAIFPATHYVTIGRAVYLRGAGPAELWWELLLLVGYAIVFVAWARRTLEART